MLKSLRPIPYRAVKVKVNGKVVEIPEWYQSYVEDGFWDFLRFNKQKRKEWVPALVEAFQLYNSLIVYNLSDYVREQYLQKIANIAVEIEGKLSKLELNIREKLKGKKNNLNLDYKNNQQAISLQNIRGLLQHELREYNYLKALYVRIKKYHDDAAKDQDQLDKQLKAKGHVDHRDDVNYDPSVFDYEIPVAYTHPFNVYDNVSHAALAFAITKIYPDLSEVISIQQAFVDDQSDSFATDLTLDFKEKFSILLQVKSEEIRQARQGLAQSAYDRITRDLIDENTLPKEMFGVFSECITKDGNFSTFILERADLDKFLSHVKEKQQALKKPWFSRLRPAATKRYNEQKTFLESTYHTLESHKYDTRALIDLAEKNDANSVLKDLFTEFQATSAERNNLNPKNLFDTTLEGEYKNLKDFIEFLSTKEKDLKQKVANTGFFAKRFDRSGKRIYDQRQAHLAFIEQFKRAAIVTKLDHETYESTNKIKIVVEHDSATKKDLIESYNQKATNMLHTGTAVQLMEERIYYKRQEEVLNKRQQKVSDRDLFTKALAAYNAFREKKGRNKVELNDDAIIVYEKIRNEGDFAEFLVNYDIESKKDTAEDLQLNTYLIELNIDLISIEDRFINLLKNYNQYRSKNRKEIINLANIFICPAGTQIESDKQARRQAYQQLQKNGDLNEFLKWFDEQLKAKDVKDISDRGRHFRHYLESVSRELTNPSRTLAARLNERIQDAYDRFTDLIIYHGVNQFNINQALRYIELIRYSIENGTLTSVPGFDFSKRQEKEDFLEGLAFARQLINGENVRVFLDNNDYVEKGIKEKLNRIIPEEKINNTGHADVLRLLITRFTRVHLRNCLAKSTLSQTQIDSDATIKANAGHLMNLISNHTVVNVNKQYEAISNDAYSYFKRLLFVVDDNDQIKYARTRPEHLIPISDDGDDTANFDNIGKYIEQAITTNNDKEANISKFKQNLQIQIKPQTKVKVVCCLEDVTYDWDEATIKQLLARINFSDIRSANLRKEVINRYIEAIAKAKNNGELMLAALVPYANVYSIIFNKDELATITRLMFGLVFDPKESKIIISDKLNIFITKNAVYINNVLHEVIKNYIVTTKNPFDYTTADTIFAIGSHANKESYATKQISSLLKAACDSQARNDDNLRTPTINFISYLIDKKFELTASDLLPVFEQNQSSNEIDFWRETHDRLACAYLKNNAGSDYLQAIRMSQINHLLRHTASDINAIKDFYAYLLSSGRDIFPGNKDDAQEQLYRQFSEFFANIYPSTGEQNKIAYLNKAELIALYFDIKGEWLDKIRLMKIELVLNDKIKVQQFIQEIKYAQPARPFPATETGKEQFKAILREKFIKDSEISIFEHYQFNSYVKVLVFSYLDPKDELADQIRLAEFIDAYKRNDIDTADGLISEIGILQQKFPVTDLGLLHLNDFFGAVAVPQGEQALIKQRFNYNKIVENIALAFDSEQVYLNALRLGRISKTLVQGNMIDAQNDINYINEIDKKYGRQFPAKRQQEFDNLLLAYIYLQNEGAKAPIVERYNYSTVVEAYAKEWGSVDTKEKCILARIAVIFRTVDQSQDAIADVSIQSFNEDYPGLALNEVSQAELNEILEYYVKRAGSFWNPELEKLIKAFEPENNNGRLLKAYRRKRIAEIFNKVGLEFTDKEYKIYQAMLGNDVVVSLENIQRRFGGQDADISEIKMILQNYILNFVKLAANPEQFNTLLIREANIYDLAVIMVNDKLLKGAKITDIAYKDIKIGEKEVYDDHLYDVWVRLLQVCGAVKDAKEEINEVENYLHENQFVRASYKFLAAQRRFHNPSDKTKGSDQNYLHTMAGITEISTEVAKEYAGYQLAMSESNIESKIKTIVKKISTTNEIDKLRIYVQELISIYEHQVPGYASVALKTPLALLKVRQHQLKQNLILARGTFDCNDALELLEFIQLIPEDNNQMARFQLVKEFYRLIVSGDLEKIKANAKEISSNFYTLLLNKTNALVAKSWKNYTGIIDIDGLFREPSFSSSGVDNMLIDRMREILQENATNKQKILSIFRLKQLKLRLKDVYDELVEIVNQLEEKELEELIAKHNLRNSTEKSSIIAFCSSLNERRLEGKLQPVRNLLLKLRNNIKLTSNDIVNELLSLFDSNRTIPGQLRNALADLIIQLKNILNLQEQDVVELKEALADIKDNKLIEYLGNLIDCCIAENDSKQLSDYIKMVIFELNKSRFDKLNKKLCNNIDLAQNKETVQKKLRAENEIMEIRAIKATVQPLGRINECAYIKEVMKEMQDDFITSLPDNIQREVNYVSNNISNINDSYNKFINVLNEVNQNNYTYVLDTITLPELEYLQKGLDKKRLSELQKILGKLIDDASESDSSALKTYLMSIRDYLNRKPVNISLASEAFADYTSNLRKFTYGLSDITVADYKQLEIATLKTAFANIINRLSGFDKTLILGAIQSDKNPVNVDIFKVLSVYLAGNSPNEAAQIKRYERFEAYVSIMKAVSVVKNPNELNIESKIFDDSKSLMVILEPADLREEGETVSSMQKSIKQTVSAIVKGYHESYFRAFRLLVLNFGTDEEVNAVLDANFNGILDVFKTTYIQTYKHHGAEYALDFMGENDIAELSFILQHYKGDSGLLRTRIESQISLFIEALNKNIMDIRTLVKYGAKLINAFGNEEHKAILAYFKDAVQYVDCVQLKKQYHGLYQLQQNIASDKKDALEHVGPASKIALAEHKNLRKEIEVSKVQDAITRVKHNIGLSQSPTKQPNTVNCVAVRNILKAALNIKNTAIRKLGKPTLEQFVDDLATLYLYCQISDEALSTSGQISKEIDQLFANFLQQYINIRNDRKDVLNQSVPCSTLFAQALIDKLANDIDKAKVRECEDELKKALAVADKAVKLGRSIDGMIINALLNKQFQHQEAVHQFIQEINKLTQDIPNEQVKLFIQEYNKHASENLKIIDIKWAEYNQNKAPIELLKDKLISKFMSELSFQYGKRSNCHVQNNRTISDIPSVKKVVNM